MIVSWEIIRQMEGPRRQYWYKTREISTGGIYQGAKLASLS